MPTVAVITQPNYLPWLGYFEQVARADVFVFLDTVQFARREWQSRNRLKGSNGQPFWVSVPVACCPQRTPLKEIEISTDQPHWRRKHLNSIRRHLGGTPYFGEVFPTIESLLEEDHRRLVDLNIAGIERMARLLGLRPRFVRASEFGIAGRRAELLVHLCRAVGADVYYSSLGASVYLAGSEPLFSDAGIELRYQHWQHPYYPQRGDAFVSHLSVVDALANVGLAKARETIGCAPSPNVPNLLSA
jgi:hypothetical protein